jgi:hypothetical protein
VDGSCEHDNEPSVSIKCSGNFSIAETLAAPQRRLSSMELVITSISVLGPTQPPIQRVPGALYSGVK